MAKHGRLMTSSRYLLLSSDSESLARGASRILCHLQHVRKMLLELVQMLYTANHMNRTITEVSETDTFKALGRAPRQAAPSEGPPDLTPLSWSEIELWRYKPTHYKHPMARWIRSYPANYAFTADLAQELASEYTYRWGKVHACERHLAWLRAHPPPFPSREGIMAIAPAPGQLQCSGPWAADKLAYTTVLTLEPEGAAAAMEAEEEAAEALAASSTGAGRGAAQASAGGAAASTGSGVLAPRAAALPVDSTSQQVAAEGGIPGEMEDDDADNDDADDDDDDDDGNAVAGAVDADTSVAAAAGAGDTSGGAGQAAAGRRRGRASSAAAAAAAKAPTEYWAIEGMPPGCSPVPLCMPLEYRRPNAVEGYRAYYNGAKAGGPAGPYTKRPPPDWLRIPPERGGPAVDGDEASEEADGDNDSEDQDEGAAVAHADTTGSAGVPTSAQRSRSDAGAGAPAAGSSVGSSRSAPRLGRGTATTATVESVSGGSGSVSAPATPVRITRSGAAGLSPAVRAVSAASQAGSTLAIARSPLGGLPQRLDEALTITGRKRSRPEQA